MIIIRPNSIAEAMLVSSDVPENDYSSWSSTTAYVVGDKVLYQHKNYECLVNNTNYDPVTYSKTTVPKWLDLGYCNRWRMFDTVVGTQTVQDESITVTIAAGLIDSIAFLDCEATSISITMTDPIAGVVYEELIDMVIGGGVIDGYTYFFEPIITTDSAVLLGIPPYGSANLEIVITNVGGEAKIGTLAVGTKKSLGLTLYDPTISITDYSKKDVDAFGNYTIIERRFSKKFNCDLLLDSSAVDDLQKTLAMYRATPLIWVGSDVSYSSMIIYGFYKSFQIVVPNRNKSNCSLEIEGLS